MGFNRRQFVLSALASPLLRGQQPKQSSTASHQMLLDYFAEQLENRARAVEAERSSIRTAGQLRLRSEAVRANLLQMLGPGFSKPPLASRRTATIERKNYKIENVLFQSRPDFWVPANVYVPTNVPGPFPAVLIQRGHFNAERMSADYQQFYIDLVTAGFVVLAFDPIGQGERRQHYGTAGTTFDESLSPTLEHCAIGSLLLLIGESAARHFVWDAIRAIDYLASRSDVMADRIGLADHTDTGWSSVHLCAADQRIKAAALHVHGSAKRTRVDPLSWNLIDDSEQQLFPAAKLGVDDLDILASITPRPLLTLIEDRTDEFAAAENHLTNCYRLAQSRNSFSIERATSSAEWPRDLRLAAVRWLKRWLSDGRGPTEETEAVIERYTALRVTPSASRSDLGEPIYRYILEKSSRSEAKVRTSAALRGQVEKLIGSRLANVPFDTTVTYSQQLSGFRISQIEFTSEPGIRIPALLYRPSRESRSCVVCADGDATSVGEDFDDDDDNPVSSQTDATKQPYETARKLVDRGVTVLVVDVRGLGMTRPNASRRDYRGKYEHLHNSDVALANMAWSLGESLFAMRVKDLLRAVEFGTQFGKVHLAGVYMGALWATFAAALDARIASVSIQNGLTSFRSLAEHGRFAHSPSQFVPGILKQMDIPTVAGLIAPRPLAILDPVDHDKQIIGLSETRRKFASTAAAYQALRAEKHFAIHTGQDLAEIVRL